MNPQPQRGLTLIEIVIALALSTLVLALVGSLFVASLSAWRRGNDVREAQVQAQTLVEVVARDVRNASQAPSVTLRPRLTVDEGEPLLSIADARPASQGGEALWILYLYVPERREVVRQTMMPSAEGRVNPRASRIVATGVDRIDVTQVANGVTVEVAVRRGREVATSRATAAPRNP